MMVDIDELINEQDFSYEETLAKNDKSVDSWISYYESKINHPLISRVFVIKRAVDSVKTDATLWNMYLDVIIKEHKFISKEDQLAIFDQCVKEQPKSFPLWIKILDHLLDHQFIEYITYIRRKFNQCLQNLPVEDHDKIWSIYLKFADIVGGKTGVNIYMRFFKFIDPRVLKGIGVDYEIEVSMNILDFIEKLIEFGDVDDVLKLYSEVVMVNSNEYSNLPKSQLEILFNYLDFLIAKSQISDKEFEKIVNKAIDKFPDQITTLQLKHIGFIKKKKHSDRLQIRNLYQKCIKTCGTVQDFKSAYNEFTQFEEDEIDKLINTDPGHNKSELERMLNDFEQLLYQRKQLVNDLQLRQDINNVDFWFIRFDIFKDQLPQKIKSITEAIKSINPLKIPHNCKHKLSDIWKMYAGIYSSSSDFKTADFIISKSVQSQYPHPDELAEMYIYWSEMRLGSDYFKEEQALEVLENVLFKEQEEVVEAKKQSSFSYYDSKIPVQKRITKSIKLWLFFIDLIESFLEDNEDDSSLISQVVEAFEQMIKLKIATPNIMIRYALFLEAHKQIEKSLSIYERAVQVFKDELIKKGVWKIYSTKLKYIDNKERVKDIQERFQKEEQR
ncbi:SYF1 [Candida oxycetoniae]|uniref:Pre-mRNA-splicing factor SYF1 n=1 Tax=Candida oxycetoniae TaxID=497107 RepID=A0AAI9T0Z0_9ASCO|nr:SYF1 [Candida oxycetoniae]KAI3406861.2 SYF1 [Candida oxycetoniae]